MRGSRRFVLDTSIARAAGDVNATHLTAKRCRDFLSLVRSICHRAVFSSQLREEWKRKASRFAQEWQVTMEKRRKLDWIEVEMDDELRKTIAEVVVADKDKKDMEGMFLARSCPKNGSHSGIAG